MTPLQIAIDGPVGAGKSDISSRLAQELGLTYLYTGAMYRALSFACVNQGVAFDDKEKVNNLLLASTIDLTEGSPGSDRAYTVLLNGIDVTKDLFTHQMDVGSSAVGMIKEVRAYMVKRQQEMAQSKSVVMEGRDIGLRVLPNAQLKIYLTASVEERAHRRWEQKKNDSFKTFDQVLEDTKKRDHQDMTRAADPLEKLPDAWELDTTGLSQDQVVAKIKEELSKRNLL